MNKSEKITEVEFKLLDLLSAFNQNPSGKDLRIIIQTIATDIVVMLK